jgi:hypothetical protein
MRFSSRKVLILDISLFICTLESAQNTVIAVIECVTFWVVAVVFPSIICSPDGLLPSEGIFCLLERKTPPLLSPPFQHPIYGCLYDVLLEVPVLEEEGG